MTEPCDIKNYDRLVNPFSATEAGRPDHDPFVITALVIGILVFFVSAGFGLYICSRVWRSSKGSYRF
jgi:hypothetical protein